MKTHTLTHTQDALRQGAAAPEMYTVLARLRHKALVKAGLCAPSRPFRGMWGRREGTQLSAMKARQVPGTSCPVLCSSLVQSSL